MQGIARNSLESQEVKDKAARGCDMDSSDLRHAALLKQWSTKSSVFIMTTFCQKVPAGGRGGGGGIGSSP